MTNKERAELICRSNQMPTGTRLSHEIEEALNDVYSRGFCDGAKEPERQKKTSAELDNVLGTALCACGLCMSCQSRRRSY